MSHNSVEKTRDAPHEGVVGSLIALTVVSIVMDGLFLYYWWATLVKVILALVLIKEIIQFISNADARRNYQYHTSGEDVLHIWIAAIIVSVAMSLIFHWDPWWARIAPAVLNIKAIEITILLIVTKLQESEQQRKDGQMKAVQSYSGYGQPARVIRVVEEEAQAPMASTVMESTVQQYSSIENQKPAENATFCPMCGKQHGPEDRFCPGCGSDLRV